MSTSHKLTFEVFNVLEFTCRQSPESWVWDQNFRAGKEKGTAAYPFKITTEVDGNAYLTMESAETSSSEDNVKFFRRVASNGATIASETKNWPPQMQSACITSYYLDVNDSGDTYTVDWDDLVIGIDTKGRNRWWLSGKYFRDDTKIEVLGIDIENKVFQKCKVRKKGDVEYDLVKHAYIIISDPGISHFKLKIVISDTDIDAVV